MSTHAQDLLKTAAWISAGARHAQTEGDDAASIELSLLAAQYAQLAKQFERIDVLLANRPPEPVSAGKAAL